MKAKVFQVGLLVASIFTVTSMAHAEEKEIYTPHPVAISSYIQDYNVSRDEAIRRLNIMNESKFITDKIIGEFGEENIAGIFFDNNSKDFRMVVRTTKKVV